MSIRLKLALAFASLAAVVLATTLALTHSALQSAAAQKVATDVRSAVQLFNTYVDQYRAETRLQIEGSFKEFRGGTDAEDLRRTFVDRIEPLNNTDDEFGLGDEPADQVTSRFRELHQELASADLTELKRNDVFVVTNATGKVIYNYAAPDAMPGVPLPHLDLLTRCLRGSRGAALWSPKFLESLGTTLAVHRLEQNDLLLVLCEPLQRPGRSTVGAVLLGQSVRRQLAAFESLSSDAGDARDDGRVLLALQASDGALAGRDPRVLAALAADPDRRMNANFLLDAAGRTYTVEGIPIDPLPGSNAYLMRDLQPEIADFMRAFFGRTFFLSVLGIFVVGLLLAQLLSRRLASPLIRLEAAAHEIQRGNLDVMVEPLGKDEVGRLAETFNSMVAGLKQRDQIKGLFKRYLNPHVVDELIRHPEKASPGGDKRPLTLLFSDLVGFTAASETMSPEELVTLLNRYFETATRALATHGATVDKFIGDAIMAFWNAPLPDGHHPANACRAALALLEVVDTLRESFRLAGFPNLDCRIGINTGPCVVGNLGSNDAQGYTAIGDAVNLASRLEGACKVYGTRTLVSEDTVNGAREAASFRELDLVRVKGRANPVRVFELLGPAGAPVPPHVTRYAEGLALFRARRFADAAACFRQSPDDAPSRLFAERCDALVAAPPGEDWDGVHTLSTK